jgi:hypothetical protein
MNPAVYTGGGSITNIVPGTFLTIDPNIIVLPSN